MYWRKDAPLICRAEIERSFEELLPYSNHGYLRPLRLSELPSDEMVGYRWYGVFSMEGELQFANRSRHTLSERLAKIGICVHQLH